MTWYKLARDNFFFVTDITSSEGKLPLYSVVVLLVDLKKHSKSEVISSIKIVTPLKNEKLIYRFLTTMEKIGILETRDVFYVLSAEGKAFYDLICDKVRTDASENTRLIDFEKLFYFKWLFSNIYPQLGFLLEILDEVENKDDIMYKYFKKLLEFPMKSWSKEVIRRNLNKLSQGERASFFVNKFGCLKNWLAYLGIINSKELTLTKPGIYLVNRLKKLELLPIKSDIFNKKQILIKNLYTLASSLFSNKKTFQKMNYDIREQKELFMDYFKISCSKFSFERTMVNIKTIRSWICANLLIKKSLILEEHEFDKILKLMWDEGIIRSILTDQKGRPVYVTLE